jgi:NTP pyrophosphatase (non-canonical NTP hydrolase)
LNTEAGELLSLVEWMSDEQLREALEYQDFNKAMKDELSDVFFHLMNICTKLDVDLVESFNKKFENSETRFPIDKAKKFNPVEWKLKKIREKKEVKL